MFYTYILRLSNGKYYIGQTNNLLNRLNRHQSGQATYTKKFLPCELVYSEQFTSRSEAMRREKYLKSLKDRTLIEKLINNGGGPIV